MFEKLPRSGVIEVAYVHLMHFAVGNVDKRANVTAQINLRVHLHGSFGLAQTCPRKHFAR